MSNCEAALTVSEAVKLLILQSEGCVYMKKVEVMLEELRVINVGLADFAKSLVIQKVKVAQVDWRPPAGDEALQKILNALLG